jgi:hypothetical protein
MADYMKQTRTLIRHEYVLDTPSNGAELDKMLAGARKDCEQVRVVQDDTLHVEANDGEIIIWWQEED